MSDNEVRDRFARIRAVFDQPGLGTHVATVRADAERREMSVRRPDSIVTAAGFPREHRADHGLVPIHGSIMMFWARRGSKEIDRLAQAYTSGDHRTLRELSRDIAERLENEPILALEDATAAMVASPMHFEVRYGSKVLISTLTLPEGVDLGLMAFPYNGGAIDEDQFSLVQFHRAGETVDYSTLFVIVPPILTELEIAALDLIPIDQIGINVGASSCCAIATVAIVAIVVALVTQAGIWQELGDRMNEVHLSAEQLERLGPMASARELVALRREIFEAHGF